MTREYDASMGKDYMISFEEKVATGDNPDAATLYSLLRLRIPSQFFTGEAHFLPVLEGAALIREIHTFGEQLGI